VVGPGDTVTLVSPGFGLYPLHLDVAGARILRVELSPEQDFAYDEETLLAAARSSKVVFLGSPNNPTGSLLELKTLKRLLAETDALVVVDEGCRDFANQDFAPMLGRQTPLVLLRTYSAALALAGLRFGYLLGPPAFCTELQKVLLPYSVNSLTQAAVLDLIGQRRARLARVEQVQAERSRLAAALRSMGRRVVEGGANSLLFQSAEPAVEFQRLLELGVLVRDLSSSVPGFLRVTIGTPPESDRFLESLEEIGLQDALSDMNA
jgi:histidinol-phosphate aminotransferase